MEKTAATNRGLLFWSDLRTDFFAPLLNLLPDLVAN
jgi:hypothetical protein